MQFLLVIASREPGPHRRPKDQRAGLAGPQDAILCQAIANVCANRPNVLCRHVPRALGHGSQVVALWKLTIWRAVRPVS